MQRLGAMDAVEADLLFGGRVLHQVVGGAAEASVAELRAFFQAHPEALQAPSLRERLDLPQLPLLALQISQPLGRYPTP